MDHALCGRRLYIFAISHGVDLQCGRAYPRGKFTDLLIDILQGKGVDKRKAISQVRASLASSVPVL